MAVFANKMQSKMTLRVVGYYLFILFLFADITTCQLKPGPVADNGQLQPQDITGKDALPEEDNLVNADREKGLPPDSGNANSLPQADSSGPRPLCDLYPSEEDVHEQIKRLQEGATTKLIKYHMKFHEYEEVNKENPLDRNMTRNFKASHWQRISSAHGQHLLSLAFNYDVLSLRMLTFGVEDLDIDWVDSPKFCFEKLEEQHKIDILLDILVRDFKDAKIKDELWLNENDFVCHEIIKEEDGYAEFVHECCTKTKKNQVLTCKEEVSGTVKGLYVMLTILKVSFLMFGPILLYKWFYKESIKKAGYVVPLKEKLTKTLLLKKVRVEDGASGSHVHHRREMKQFRRFRQIVRNVPSDEIVTITFKKLHVLVDHAELISEKCVPVGLFSFLYENVIRCGMIKHEPFTSCCAESLFGSWSKRFLWLKLMDGSDCNRSCRKFCSWAHIFRFLGGLFLLLLVPLPYIARTVLYYWFEEEKVSERRDAIKQLDLDYKYGYNLYQYASPTHGVLIGMYVAYVGSFCLLWFIKRVDPERYEKSVRGAIQDLRNVSCVEALRMLMAHLLLPFEKFGVLCGVLCAAVYWPFALPTVVFLVLSYCIPTLYLAGRFLIPIRPRCLQERPLPTKYKDKSALLSKGTTSFDTCLLLENISPDKSQLPPSPDHKASGQRKSTFCCHKEDIGALVISIVIGFLCIINMVVLLCMYAEVVGFVAEVAVLTLMGAIINAGSAAKYVMLGFWVFLYTTTCFNHAYELYVKLNVKIFEYLKQKLGSEIEAVTILPDDEQQHTAFKYFSTTELRGYLDKVREYALPLDYMEPEPERCRKRKHRSQGVPSEDIVIEDVVADQNGRLYWSIKSLVMFVDNMDVPRIPKKLFFEICEQEVPGCPGPVYKSMINATRKLLYMVVFLAFVFVIVVSFGNVYQVSNTNQMLLTLASGFLPFVVRFVFMPKDAELDLNSYSFNGRIHQILFGYSQPWPVFDLSFDTPRDPSLEDPEPPLRPQPEPLENQPPGDPTHVDLLITIRDEEGEENLRSEPGSFGSNRSLHNPDEGAIGQPPPGGANNPTNAFLHNTSRTPSYSSPEITGSRSQSDQPSPQSHQPPAQSRTASPLSTNTTSAVQQPAGATAAENTQTPRQKRVDLIVDLNKGGVQVRRPEPDMSEPPANGIPMWPLGQSAQKDVDTESAV